MIFLGRRQRKCGSVGDLEARVFQAEARIALNDLAIQYAIACDFRDVARLVSTYAEDATFSHLNGTTLAKGAQAIGELCARSWREMGQIFHIPYAQTVEFESREIATGVVYVRAEMWLEDIGPLSGWMRYNDTYRAIEGSWKFQSRAVAFGQTNASCTLFRARSDCHLCPEKERCRWRQGRQHA